MIVSHKYKYVFIQSPRTGCTAIGRELIDNYHGERILYKHAAYHDYLRIATPEMKNYFVFSSIRNPLDEIQSFYYKFKTNHDNDFTDPKSLKKNGGWVTPRIMKVNNFIMKNDADFVSFLNYFYKMPYVNWSILDHNSFNYIIRYENLQEDLSTVLSMIGIDQIRPLPLINKTKKEKIDLIPALNSEELKKLNWVLGPMTEVLGYPPISDSHHNYSFSNRVAFKLMCLVKTLYWRHIRHHL